MPQSFNLVMQYFFMAGIGVGSGLLIPFIIGLLFKNKLSEGEFFPWQKSK